MAGREMWQPCLMAAAAAITGGILACGTAKAAHTHTEHCPCGLDADQAPLYALLVLMLHVAI